MFPATLPGLIININARQFFLLSLFGIFFLKMKSYEAKYNTKRLRAAYNTTVASIALVLFMLGLLLTVIFQFGKLSSYFRENIGISIVIDSKSKADEVMAFKALLEAKNFVKSVKYISKQQAAEQLKLELGEDFVEFIGYNPLPPTFELFLFNDYTYGDSLVRVKNFLKHHPMVESVEYRHTLLTLIDKNILRFSRWIISFSFLLLIISVLLIHNTIRIAIYSKRLLIKSMLLVGATQAFIQRPFIMKGIYQGLLSGLMAVLMLLIVLIIANQKLPGFGLFDNVFILGLIGASVIIFGMLITWISNLIAIKKYLKLKSEDLY